MIQTLWQAVRFGVVGLANTAVGLLAIYATMYFTDVGPLVANAIGYAIGMVLSFSLNRIWTFKNDQSITSVLPRYLAAALVSYLLNLSVVYVLYKIYGTDKYVSQLFGIVTYTLFMFFICKIFVFRKQSHSSIGNYQ